MTAQTPHAEPVPGCAECARLHAEIAEADAARVRIEARQARARFTVPLEKYGLQLDCVRIRLKRRGKDLTDHVEAVHGLVDAHSIP